MASSTPTPDRPPAGSDTGDDEADVDNWQQRHEEARIDHDSLTALIERFPFQLKFVLTGREDLSEVDSLIDDLRAETETETEIEIYAAGCRGQLQAEARVEASAEENVATKGDTHAVFSGRRSGGNKRR